MKILKKNLVSRGFAILALFALFFLLPVNRVRAANDYRYFSNDTTIHKCVCHNFQALDRQKAEEWLKQRNPLPEACDGRDVNLDTVVERAMLQEGRCIEGNLADLSIYHCFVISDLVEGGKFKQGECRDFGSTKDPNDFNDRGRNYCASTAADADKVETLPGPCPSPSPDTGPIPGTSVKELLSDAASRLNPAGIVEPTQLVGRFIKILMAFIGSIALVLYVWSGFLWMTASGNTEQVGKAKNIMVWTTLGVVVMLSSYMLASFVFKSLGL